MIRSLGAGKFPIDSKQCTDARHTRYSAGTSAEGSGQGDGPVDATWQAAIISFKLFLQQEATLAPPASRMTSEVGFDPRSLPQVNPVLSRGILGALLNQEMPRATVREYPVESITYR